MTKQEFDEFLKLLEKCTKEDIEEMQKLYDKYIAENNESYCSNKNVDMNVSKESSSIGEAIIATVFLIVIFFIIVIGYFTWDEFFRRWW